MKVLMCHNFYRSEAPSGEDVVYRNEVELLRSFGHEVISYEKHNDELSGMGMLGKAKLAVDAAWSKRTYRELNGLVERTRPDVVHFHNTFPQISPSGYAACAAQGVPVVQTLHNYRLACASGTLFREGAVCEDCLGRTPFPALMHRCYRGSIAGTASVAWMIQRNRWAKTFERLVDQYIALTEFAATRMVASGLPAERISLKPNFLNRPPGIGEERCGYGVYVGRISREKGVGTLIRAWSGLKTPLKVIGSGPLSEELERTVRDKGLKMEFLGLLSHAETMECMRSAEFLVIPSEWHEGFPMVVLEAYACGTPVVASRIGSLAEIVDDGVTGMTFPPGSADGLRERIRELMSDSGPRARLAAGARRRFDERYSRLANYRNLMEIYSSILFPEAVRRQH